MDKKITDRLIDLAKTHAITWEELARECLKYMSENDVIDMAYTNGYL